ncbi:MAG: tRNA (adenosine(37)-N6)-threonylcarbamoyltransferase complex dimerization subunit type 1 TsaB [Burkholderiaceae bacterium]|nr:tRNA (adenosine(37)-N6)-threonylcarbamoyltransferase complex dimerization subunit type 1 TsaB [Burkholderiaceae bacterium]
MSTLRLLVLDASTETLHLGLLQDQALLSRALPGGAQASATLLPALRELLEAAGCAATQLDAIGFGHGPGAFTGLRTACAVAQGLALGLDRPLLALDTLAAVAQHAGSLGATAPCWSVLDARMGELYAACWERDAAGRWRAASPPALYSPAGFAAALAARPAAVAGNALALPEVATRLRELGIPAAAQFPTAQPVGAALAALARDAWAAGEHIDPAQALPLYVRDKVALTTAERQAAAASKAAP